MGLRTTLYTIIISAKVTKVAMILLILFFCCELGKVKMLKQIHSNEDFTIVTALLGKTGRLSFGVNGALKKFKVKKGTAT